MLNKNQLSEIKTTVNTSTQWEINTLKGEKVEYDTVAYFFFFVIVYSGNAIACLLCSLIHVV